MSIDTPAPSRLELRDLRLVLALATSRTTAAAAQSLHLTQPAVSRALIGAEQRLGVRLFERTPRGLEPTAAGQALIGAAPQLLQDMSALEAQLGGSRAAGLRIRMVCECYTAYHWMPSTIQRVNATLPGLELSIDLEATADPLRALQEGRIDVALISEAATPRRGGLAERALFADEVVFVMSSAHRLASRATLTRADLQDEALFTSRAPTRDMVWFLKPLAGGKGDRPLNYQVLPLTEAVIDFARAGMGLGVLSEWVAAPHLRHGELLARRLASGAIRRPWRLVWRKPVEAIALHLAQILEQSAPRLLPLASVARAGARRRA